MLVQDGTRTDTPSAAIMLTHAPSSLSFAFGYPGASGIPTHSNNRTFEHCAPCCVHQFRAFGNHTRAQIPWYPGTRVP
eukprot:614710-Rhodomonas_salina.1